MRSIKPGRGPSAMNAMGSVFVVIFGIFWTAVAFKITRNAPAGIGTFFPLFGVCFVIMGIVQAAYNFRNATSENRYSTFDITGSKEEPDPLNEAFVETAGTSAEHRLKELETLRAKGLITMEEYQRKRAEILKSV